jgi:transposase
MLKIRLRPYLADLQKRKVTNRAVAKVLGVSEAHLSRVLKGIIVKDPANNERKARKDLLATRKIFRDSVANTLSIKEAAKRANCSERTIYRHKHGKVLP